MLRFTPTERALHWAFALVYLLLLASGLLLMVPELRIAFRGYTPQIGLRLHLLDSVLWLVVPLAVVALGDRRRLRRTWRELTTFDSDDWRWLRRFPRWLLGRRRERVMIDESVGKFNAGQKLNAIFTVVSSVLLLLTGLALWPLGASGAPLVEVLTGPNSAGFCRQAHRWLSVLVLLPLAGHVFLAVVYPSTRPSLAGMVRGTVDREWAATHYPRWRSET